MTNLPKLSSRAQKALDVLADGGRFVHRLERDSYPAAYLASTASGTRRSH